METVEVDGSGGHGSDNILSMSQVMLQNSQLLAESLKSIQAIASEHEWMTFKSDRGTVLASLELPETGILKKLGEYLDESGFLNIVELIGICSERFPSPKPYIILEAVPKYPYTQTQIEKLPGEIYNHYPGVGVDMSSARIRITLVNNVLTLKTFLKANYLGKIEGLLRIVIETVRQTPKNVNIQFKDMRGKTQDDVFHTPKGIQYI